MKNLIKKCSLFVLILISCFLLGGCTMQYNLTLKNSGLIETEMYFDLSPLDDEKFSKVYSAINVYFNSLDQALEENAVALYSNIYNFEELNLNTNRSKFTYILNQNSLIVNDSEILSVGKKVVLKKSFYSLTSNLSRTLGLYYIYAYPSALEYSQAEKQIVLKSSYTGLMDDVPLSSTLTIEEGTFSANYIQNCHPLYYNGEEPKFLYDWAVEGVSAGTTLKSYLLSVTGLTEEAVDIIFNFSTPYERVHSNGVITQTKSNYTHTWQLTSVDSTITIYRNIARPLWWYVICGAIGVLIIGGGLAASIIIQNHRKKVGMEALKKIDELINN